MNATLDNAKNTLKYYPNDADKLRAKLSQMIEMYERDVINNVDIREIGVLNCEHDWKEVNRFGDKECIKCREVKFMYSQFNKERT